MCASANRSTAPSGQENHKSLFRSTFTRRGATPAQPGSRDGFTVVEMLVAIVILSVGVLGLAATSAVVLRQMTGAKTQTNAAQIAASRVEMLSGKLCSTTATTGSAVSGAVKESWTIAPASNKTLTATVSVAFKGRANPEQFKTVIACF
jgi:prepilin-type N-terminal cleavage/methylation domain-containing protein